MIKESCLIKWDSVRQNKNENMTLNKNENMALYGLVVDMESWCDILFAFTNDQCLSELYLRSCSFFCFALFMFHWHQLVQPQPARLKWL